ncbi:MAG: toll/interleukin-1 receptor domain-containing protein [Candidatus Heimdallarchaeota archaeon]|nr:toll/interleukin-1 receptor domain-containing protein [Candidatus Heimdallarchaeota archaeon]
MSHISDAKGEVARLKDGLDALGASCFIAHENIQPTKEWQEEIENALATMDAFVAILTDGFHNSEWTDQGVGYALARGIPIIAVRLGQDPYGFIGRAQALSCDWQDAPLDIVKLLIAHSAMVDGYIGAIRECNNFDSGNALATLLPLIAVPSVEQIRRIVEGYNSGTQARGAYGFNGDQPSKHGPGLLHYLNKWSAQQYRLSRDGEIEELFL